MQNLLNPGRLLLLGTLLLGPRPSLQGQHHTASIQIHSETASDQEGSQRQITRAKEFFAFGTITGHLRNYFMTTLNRGGLTDYYSNAIGGAMRFDSPEFHGFHFGAAGIFTYKAFSSDLNAPDPTTGQISRWEHELYDILDTDNFNDLDRLEELYLQYRFAKGYATFGKLEIENTPLLNRTDERMKPFAFRGVWFHLQMKEDKALFFSWLDRISPRSTVEWFDFNEGIGLADNGFQPDGTEAEYHEHQQSKGVALLGFEGEQNNWRLKAYHWYIHHLNHTSWIELGHSQKNWDLGLQYALQFPGQYQERLDYAQRYVQPGEHGQVLSGKVRYLTGDWNLSAAFSQAFDSGRFLFPRELGRDQFFTSIPRSRLEGFGDTRILTLGGEYALSHHQLTAGLEWTRLWGPETGTYTSNKYNLDAYWQLNARLHYHFKDFLEGLHIDFLYVYKENRNDTSPETIFNQSNFHQFNLITHFEF